MIEDYLNLALAGDYCRWRNGYCRDAWCQETCNVSNDLLKCEYLPVDQQSKRTLALLYALHNEFSITLTDALSLQNDDACFQLYAFTSTHQRRVLTALLQRDNLNLDEILVLAYFISRSESTVNWTRELLAILQQKAEFMCSCSAAMLRSKEFVMLSLLGYCQTKTTKAWYQYSRYVRQSTNLKYFESVGIPYFRVLESLYDTKQALINKTELLRALHKTCNIWDDHEFSIVLELESTNRLVDAPICQTVNYKRLVTSGKIDIIPRIFQLGVFEHCGAEKLALMSRSDQIEVLRYTCMRLKHLPMFFDCDQSMINAVFEIDNVLLQDAWEACFKYEPFGNVNYSIRFLEKQESLSQYIHLMSADTVTCFLAGVTEPKVKKALLTFCKNSNSYAILEPRAQAFSKAVQAKIAKDARDLIAKD